MTKQPKQFSVTSLVVLLILVLGFNGSISTAQDQPIQPTEQPVQSIFLDDTCAPPCWFGITPGESTSADVEAMFRRYQSMFGSLFIWYPDRYPRREDGMIVGTVLGFWWGVYTRHDTPITYPGIRPDSQTWSLISIGENGIVELISTSANREVPLAEVLELLGNPDDIYLVPVPNYDGEGGNAFALSIRYVEQRLGVRFLTFPHPTCTASSVLENFHVDAVLYYSADEASRLVPVDSVHPEQATYFPRLVVPVITGRQIRGADWDRFINGEGYEQCEDFFDSLPDTYVVPTLPWPSPTLTPTPDQGSD